MNKKNIKLPLRVWAIIFIILAGLLYAAYLESNEIDAPPPALSACALQVHFIDVGQGGSALVLFGDYAVLADAGEREQGARVVEYLQNAGVGKLDYVIATHPHSDHIGGLPAVIEEFEIGKVIAPRLKAELTPTTRSYENFLLAVLNKGLRLTAAKAGDSYTLYGNSEGEEAILEIISPLEPQSNAYKDINDYSVVFKISYKDTTFLFTGDASRPAERDILSSGADITADLLHVGHHGSSTSTTREFLAAVNPRAAVIQCGAGNSYNHPNINTIERLEQAGVTIYRSDLDGTIVVYSDGRLNQLTVNN
ncbi:MAG: MBL fold metallo-hydrolase [Oscillospiraceae bacterium]|nr:MBL fold metallo-hydrolase [Oscillospiraceae bacterium]